MKRNGISKKVFVYRMIFSTLFIGWIAFCICVLIQISNEHSSTPEEIAFNAWLEEFGGEVEKTYARHNSYGMVFFNATGLREPPRITDEEVRTYLSKVRIRYLLFHGYDISIQSVASLLDNAFSEFFEFIYFVDGEYAVISLDVSAKGAGRFIQKEILRLADDPNNDFQSLMFPEEKLDLKHVCLDVAK